MARVVAVVAILAAVVPAAVVRTARAAGTPRCHTRALEAHVVFGPGSGTAGHFDGKLVFRNRGRAACTLRGYPGVSFVGRHGRRLGVPAGREPARVTTVSVPAGARAASRFVLTDVGVFDPAACRPVRARGVRVYPPDERAALFIPHRLRVCRGSEPVATVGPVVGWHALPR
jgi:hypothetical protein